MAAYTTNGTGGGDFNSNSSYSGGTGHPTSSSDTLTVATGDTLTDLGLIGAVCGATTASGTAALNLPGTNTITSIANTAGTGALLLGPTTFSGACTWSGGGDDKIGEYTALPPTAPNAPDMTVVSGDDGLSAVATVTSDAGVTNQLYYHARGSVVWIEGVSGTGPGELTQTGLSANTLYYFMVQSSDGGVLSVPSPTYVLMVQTTVSVAGQTDALALAVVLWLNDHADEFCVPITAERRFRLISNLEEIPKAETYASVDVFPDVETNERLGIAPAFKSEYSIHIFIQQQVAGNPGPEAQCALLTHLRSEIVEGLKPLYFSLSDAVRPAQNVFLSHARSADKGLYNLERLLNLNVYESDTILTFKAAV